MHTEMKYFLPFKGSEVLPVYESHVLFCLYNVRDPISGSLDNFNNLCLFQCLCVTFSWLMFIESISRFCVLSHKTVCFCPFTDIEGRRWLISSCYCRLLKCLPGTWLQSRLRLYVYIDGKANVNVQHLIMQIDSGVDANVIPYATSM